MSQTDKILNDIRSYLRISAASSKKNSASLILDTYEKGVLYDKLDGQTTQTKLEQITKIPISTINRWLDSFLNGGIVAPPDEYYSNYRALFTLQELDIKIEELKKRGKKNIETNSKTEQPKPKTGIET